MSDNVVSMAEFRARRGWRALNEALITGEPVPMTSEQAEELVEMRGVEPSWVMVDEIHHWTANNTAFEQLRRAYLNNIADRPGIFEWTNATPERRRQADRALRILRGTDHGSNDGNAEGHRRDPGVPRG